MLKVLFVILACTALVNGRWSRFMDVIPGWGVHEDNVDFADISRSDELISQSNEKELENYLDSLSSEELISQSNEEDYLDSLSSDELTSQSDEEEFEDDLDSYIETQQITNDQVADWMRSTACIVPIPNLIEPLPIYISEGSLKVPCANSGTLRFNSEEEILVFCTGSNNTLTFNNNTSGPSSGKLKCLSGNTFTGPEWLNDNVTLESIKCQSSNIQMEKHAGHCAGNNSEIGIGFKSNDLEYYSMKSCFNNITAEVLYVAYTQSPENAVTQRFNRTGVFYQSEVFPDSLQVDDLYKKYSQMIAFTTILGNESAATYLNNTRLTRGHLAASADFVFSSARRATFTFTNCAPQWDTFNNGNWNTLEINLRKRIVKMGYRTQIYTGTWDILELKNETDQLNKIYLSPNDSMIPVPRWFYKVVYEPFLQKGIAYLGLNNPHVTLNEANASVFCNDVIAGDSRFSWLEFDMNNTKRGYMAGCNIYNFNETVKHLPSFTVKGLLI